MQSLLSVSEKACFAVISVLRDKALVFAGLRKE